MECRDKNCTQCRDDRTQESEDAVIDRVAGAPLVRESEPAPEICPHCGKRLDEHFGIGLWCHRDDAHADDSTRFYDPAPSVVPVPIDPREEITRIF